MSVTQTTMERSPSGDPHCPHCKAVLPPRATFCTSCGERVVKKNTTPLFQHETDIATRYRITTLVRRRPYVSLFFALDNQQQRPVAIREIDIRELSDEGRATACEMVQREYDLLRREHIPSVLPVIDLRHFQGRLYVIAGWPATASEKTPVTQLQTLQDVLQSGIGLPDTQVALNWIEQLCAALDHLHRHSIILGDIDPQALIFNGNTYESEFALMVSWLPPAVRNLLTEASSRRGVMNHARTTNFSAPVGASLAPAVGAGLAPALEGILEPSSDIYSLGAVLYLLLTGVPPEESGFRLQRRLRSPGEINPHINSSLDEFVMKALSLEPAERYQSAVEMAEALARSRSRSRRSLSKSASLSPRQGPSSPLPTVVAVKATETRAFESTIRERKIDEIVNTDTVLITPLPETSLKAWQTAKEPGHDAAEQRALSAPQTGQPQELPLQADDDDLQLQSPGNNEGIPVPQTGLPQELPLPGSSFGQNFKKRITGILPAVVIPRRPGVMNHAPTPGTTISSTGTSPNKDTSARDTQPPDRVPTRDTSTRDSAQAAPSFLKQLQRLFLGEQKHSTTAAATIETPLRVQPNQSYTIRIQLMGRNQRGDDDNYLPADRRGRINHAPPAKGLSALVEGDLVYIEVRSALYQSYAYIVQQATVYIPAQGYAAEVTIPMQPLSSGPSGRRDRLHIFFMDEMRRPIYEKPFVVELFISHLVQPGREGHNVLTIPL